jgi:ribonuclease HII
VTRRPRYLEERLLWEGGYLRVAGIDEAGRGPLAGPVVAAAVVLRRPLRLAGIDDSKRLTPEAREDLRAGIEARAEAIAWARIEHDEIDRINILQASFAAMLVALESLPAPPDFVLIDGPLAPKGIRCPHRAIVDGDALCASVAAASIVAKVERDRIMCGYDALYPGYGFARHKGYSTPEHLEALERLGPCPIHRRTFHPLTPQLSLALD